MFTKHATLALAAIGTQAIKLGAVAQVDAEAETEFGNGGNPFAGWCETNSVHPICGGLAQVDAEADAEFSGIFLWIHCAANPTDEKCAGFCEYNPSTANCGGLAQTDAESQKQIIDRQDK